MSTGIWRWRSTAYFLSSNSQFSANYVKFTLRWPRKIFTLVANKKLAKCHDKDGVWWSIKGLFSARAIFEERYWLSQDIKVSDTHRFPKKIQQLLPLFLSPAMVRRKIYVIVHSHWSWQIKISSFWKSCYPRLTEWRERQADNNPVFLLSKPRMSFRAQVFLSYIHSQSNSNTIRWGHMWTWKIIICVTKSSVSTST